MAAVGTAWENGYAERWMRALKEEVVYLADHETYADAADALKNIGHFIDRMTGSTTRSAFTHRWGLESS